MEKLERYHDLNRDLARDALRDIKTQLASLPRMIADADQEVAVLERRESLVVALNAVGDQLNHRRGEIVWDYEPQQGYRRTYDEDELGQDARERREELERRKESFEERRTLILAEYPELADEAQ